MGGSLLYYAIVFIAVALIAALLGFGGVAGVAMSGANLLISVAVIIIIAGLLIGFIRRV
jgi:uncharacterized membrane protein YtjA (UPF0391 family)